MKNRYIYKGVNIKLKNKNNILVIGPLGKIQFKLPNNIIFLKNNDLFVPKNKIVYFNNLIKLLLKSVAYGWFFEFNLKGKGFKLFKYKDYLSFDLGYSNLRLFKFKNDKFKLFTINQTVIVFSLSKQELFSFISFFKNFYYVDKYNGKGLFFKKEKKNIINKKLI